MIGPICYQVQKERNGWAPGGAFKVGLVLSLCLSQDRCSSQVNGQDEMIQGEGSQVKQTEMVKLKVQSDVALAIRPCADVLR